ncbi:MAG: hypothetical protein EBR82_25970 [Caulobacteraceae bacterium]|nr:hypothetical protein [Caulobacteraceae bacterium]
MEDGCIMNNVLAVLAGLLAVYAVLLGRRAKKLEHKINQVEQEHLHDKVKAIETERELSRKRLRDLLEHYRGDGPRGQA